jgi:hypothetical protein
VCSRAAPNVMLTKTKQLSLIWHPRVHDSITLLDDAHTVESVSSDERSCVLKIASAWHSQTQTIHSLKKRMRHASPSLKDSLLGESVKAHFLLLFIDRISTRDRFSSHCMITTRLTPCHCWHLDTDRCKVRLIISGIHSVPG